MDQAAACLTICRINQLLSPSLLLKWWKADPSMSLTSPVLQTVTRDQIKAAALKNEIEQLYPKLQRVLAAYREQGINTIPISSKQYPFWLKSIYDPPAVLFAKGDMTLLSKGRKIGIVGTRNPTAYGEQVVNHLTKEICRKGWVIVSGLASGIDGMSHAASIKAKGRTIGVIAGGFQHIYPRENLQLADHMAKHHILLSEHPPETKPQKWHFPMRNRIISGLSEGVIVVQGKEKSGSLITAYQALEQGREVFAVPGSLFDPYAGGPIKLIQQGAKAIWSAEDIFEELPERNVQYTEPF
ncbi:DNA-processing protein DprA [Bacillus subtilis]|uniref:DNA-processing protein DprA n=1 Tax=Bacillus subtilis TaxID=1423 RepID=UPI00119C3B36|nr:DNA-processing protein DprA [Bacillus subtilis]MCY9210319.1 DNA-processing protein DprA [Bacillus subtilis]MED1810060.1 DNA-processing protein DprA [Bacillus subtilis]TWG63875.1 DNA processing protein [Bacillus subtilis J24]TWG77344.1 DNA processing protein [Bacillus subtilis J26]